MQPTTIKRVGWGAALVAIVVIWRETFAWSWGKALDALDGLFTAENPVVRLPNPFPWFDAVGIALLVATLVFLLQSFRRRRRVPLRTEELSDGLDRFRSTMVDQLEKLIIALAQGEEETNARLKKLEMQMAQMQKTRDPEVSRSATPERQLLSEPEEKKQP